MRIKNIQITIEPEIWLSNLISEVEFIKIRCPSFIAIQRAWITWKQHHCPSTDE